MEKYDCQTSCKGNGSGRFLHENVNGKKLPQTGKQGWGLGSISHPRSRRDALNLHVMMFCILVNDKNK